MLLETELLLSLCLWPSHFWDTTPPAENYPSARLGQWSMQPAVSHTLGNPGDGSPWLAHKVHGKKRRVRGGNTDVWGAGIPNWEHRDIPEVESHTPLLMQIGKARHVTGKPYAAHEKPDETVEKARSQKPAWIITQDYHQTLLTSKRVPQQVEGYFSQSRSEVVGLSSYSTHLLADVGAFALFPRHIHLDGHPQNVITLRMPLAVAPMLRQLGGDDDEAVNPARYVSHATRRLREGCGWTVSTGVDASWRPRRAFKTPITMCMPHPHLIHVGSASHVADHDLHVYLVPNVLERAGARLHPLNTPAICVIVLQPSTPHFV
ncbi:hypothetical protein BDZ89DRAFT_1117678 [Hymenopellis radicata]|nr:hypothetical protein BDZ89DRAFT_1117678 [Hymenopellis radicata]